MTHVFERDLDVPRDGLGRVYCRCGLPGRPGDDRHKPPEVDDAVRELEARRLGEAQEDA